MQYSFPEGLRPASVAERDTFYRHDFPVEEVAHVVDRLAHPTFVVDVGTESTLYRPRLKQFKGKLVRITDYDSVEDLKEKLIDYAPEDIYYETTIQDEDEIVIDPDQELVFDLDPENVECRHCERRRPHVQERLREKTFCLQCFTRVATKTQQLHDLLSRHFDGLRVVFSGRGFHIHVDDDAAFKLDREDRRQFAQKVGARFPIDERVTNGETGLIRLPGSLNGLVARVAAPVPVTALNDPEQLLNETTAPDFF